ncbi:uncharacterized protein BJ171DRAFT_495689 [Polychytrium aggregatum]|uniref:uncharacterized protein n=1 Tax=Polychytrium aggregatum TaxID=110093 RepID=UPI0022FF17FE|nr:uncharacterized protein BJ171DRAFT_495689 [Polychytrium aggregatum]KAI9207117.1 hypothetical protein BJ171DRAFT_495689 [Polychytrium aggregatum]
MPSLDEPTQPRTLRVYPLEGVRFLIEHPKLWRNFLVRVSTTCFVSLLATILLFTLAMPAQAAALERAISQTWACWLIAVLLTIFESAAFVLVWSYIVLPLTLDRLFDDVLRLRGHGDLVDSRVTSHRQVYLRFRHREASKRIQQAVNGFVVALTLPVNLIPIAGQVVFYGVNGYLAAWSLHLHYFDLKGCTFQEGVEYVQSHKARYVAFGVWSIVTGSIPVLSWFFVFTNTIAAAVWAADLEDAGLGPKSQELVDAS